ncbi:helix-turn-helix transcriptional regulator [Thalassotalea sediminis]|uniref:helix-turn-helix transcriptional regulator n=1 Tax=Thalassotalea sediminis TaxID=1759089 RepID=UPI0025742F57|nr:AraC family transcriptional regulator [Thalassotalea sediminis]
MLLKQSSIIPAASFNDFGLRMIVPNKLLANWVQCLWTTNPMNATPPLIEEKLYPDAGSSLMFIFNNNSVDIRYYHYTQVITHRWDTSVHYISVRFKPGAAQALLDIDSLSNQNEEIDLITNNFSTRAELQRLAESMDKLSIDKQLEKIQCWLLQRAMHVQQRFNKWIAILTQASSCLIAPNQLAEKYGFSRRTLERQLRKYSGCSPLQLYGFAQIRGARQRLITTSDSLSEIALDCGYYDQAHFTNVFHEKTLETPLQYRKRKLSQISNR